jgi:hypothetical protein
MFAVYQGSRNRVFKGAQIWGAQEDQNQDLIRHDTVSVCLFSGPISDTVLAFLDAKFLSPHLQSYEWP